MKPFRGTHETEVKQSRRSIGTIDEQWSSSHAFREVLSGPRCPDQGSGRSSPDLLRWCTACGEFVGACAGRAAGALTQVTGPPRASKVRDHPLGVSGGAGELSAVCNGYLY